MAFREFIFKNVLYPPIDLVRGTRTIKNYKFLMKSQWWNKAKLNEYQNTKLQLLIQHAYENVPYYRKLFKTENLVPSDIKSKDDLHKIPPLKKEHIREFAFSDLLATNISGKRRISGRTGGSTGEPLQYFRDKNSKSWSVGATYRCNNWGGLRIAEKRIQLSGGSLGGFLTSKSKLTLKLEQFLTGIIVVPAFELSHENLNSYVNLMNQKKKVSYLRGYPSALFVLAKHINKTESIKREYNAVFTTAEKLYDFQKLEIEQAFNCKVFDQYGCGEINSIAAQCEETNLYHVFDEHVIVENDKTSTNKNARVTDLDNFVAPLIRYENMDVLPFSQDKCPCGRELSVLEKIEGRTHDFITTIDGNLVAGEFFPHLFQKIIGIDQYQIIQEKIDLIKVTVKPNDKYTEEEMTAYLKKIQEYCGGKTVDIELIKVNEFPPSKSGKRIFIKSNVSLNSY
ncbi:MAG: phenylacetate--CoA ligase family protein [Candidatus Heimdallarchaeota archaeon]